jgi:Protein of unknown function/AsmA-like C-terminal region
VQRIVVRVAQFFVTLVVGLAILGSFAVWRLSKGPVSLDFLTPTIERGFAANELPLAVQVEHTTLVWGGWSRVFDLRAVNVRLFGSDGKIVALLPEVSIGLSTTGLLRGDFALSRLDVIGLQASLRRHPDGRLDFALPVDLKGGQDTAGTFATIASDLLKSVREGKGLFRYIKRFSVLSARVRYVDEVNRQLWNMPAADMITVFGPEVIESRFRVVVENGGDRAELAATVLHDRKSARIGGRVDFNALEPMLIARAVPYLRQLANIRLPFSGGADFEVSSDWHLLGLRLQLASPVGRALIGMEYPPEGGHVRVIARLDDIRLSGLARATPALASLAGLDLPVSGQIEGEALSTDDFRLRRVDLAAGSGKVELPGILPRPVPVTAIHVRADVNDDQTKAAIREVSVDLGGPRLQLTGTAERVGPAFRLHGEGTLASVPMASLDDYWPVNLGIYARRWVIANITQGMVDSGTVSIGATVQADNLADIRLEEFSGTLQYQGLSVDYLAPMSKFTGVAGKATFDRGHLDLVVSKGRLRDLELVHAAINMFDLDTDIEKIAIETAMKGPARTLAHVLDEQPLGFLGALALAPTAISGEADFRTKLHFPLKRDLTAKEVQVVATGALRKLAISPAPKNLVVKDGALTVKATNEALTATGSVVLSGVPATVDWRENFTDAPKERRRLVFAGRVPEMGTPGFGLPDLRFLSGPADANVAFTQLRDGKAELLVNLELADTVVTLPELGWTKTSGTAGTANVTLAFDAKGLRKIDRVSVETGDARLLGAVDMFGADRNAWIATIERFQSGGNDLQGRVERRANGAIVADLSGKRFDMAGLVEKQSAPSAPGVAKEPRLPPVTVHARIRDLRWEDSRRVRDANVTAKYVDDQVLGLTLDGRLGSDGTLSIRYLPGPDGQVLRVAADDFGAILSMSPSESRVDGGALLIRGLRRAPDAPMEGAFHASSFTLSQAPLLARVLQVASLTGIVDILSRKGLVFEAFEGQFAYNDGRLVFGKSSAYGSSIGVTGDGVFDLGKNTVSASGTVVPAYSLNRVLGNIPLLGSLITGGKNEGLFAATYRVDGSIEEPKIDVNPLSALAPGFLRNLFGLGPEKEPALPKSQ